MHGKPLTLKDLRIGDHAKILTVGGTGALRQHLLDMGVIPGAVVSVVQFAPLGDPMEIHLHSYELTLRLDEAERIEVEISDDEPKKPLPKLETIQEIHHPGLGEGGRFHSRAEENPLPDNTILTYALVGNQNSGKTTLFNQLTGSNQHIGNFPGVTVDRKDGPIRGYPNTLVTDLPGIYSMSPYSSEERISRNFVLTERPKAIINIVDATNIERNLYLTMQLLEIGIPMVVALNMMDELTGNQGAIDVNRMEQLLGVPVIAISAIKNEGVQELIEHLNHVARYQEEPKRQDLCSEEDHGGAVHRCIHAVSHLIEDHAKASDLPLRFCACKLIEGDPEILEMLKLEENEKETLEHLVLQMEHERGLDRSAAMADMRFSFIERLCAETVRKPKSSREHERSRRIDRVLTGRFTAIPCFIAIMAAVFFLTFHVIGAKLQEWMELGITSLTVTVDAALKAAGINPVIHDLIVNGIFVGVGSVLTFLPIIIVLFFFLSLLEDSGYMARVAFVMDRLLRKIGLSGRSIVPMLLGFGCTVPAVMASRTLPSERDRRMTILLTPFMSCTAKLPIYAFFVSAFFPRRGGLIMVGLYVLGILVAILVALLFKNTLFKGAPVPFVMELPNYRLPAVRNVLQLLWQKAKDFLQRAFTVIFIATIVVWFLQSFDLHFNLVTDSSQSIMANLAGLLVPLFRPAGLGDWRLCTSLITGFMAKESVVSTMEVLFGSASGVKAVLAPATAAAMLGFCLLYTPCVAAVACVKRELGKRSAFLLVIWQCLIAWLAAFILYRIVSLF